ncbi:MAG TPA: hypothetical protein VN680_14490 [Burkholderiaceae bacterium]|nr:hypothetical protein [Burkholderiaceae bacterium]
MRTRTIESIAPESPENGEALDKYQEAGIVDDDHADAWDNWKSARDVG